MIRTAALLLGLLTPGCGILTVRTSQDPVDWPLLAGEADRPTVLVRRARDATPLVDARHEVEGSGLFSRVTHQDGQGGLYSTPSDWVLDIELEVEAGEARWYSAVGLLSLCAIPMVWHDALIVTCVVRDGEHHGVVGILDDRIERHRIAWIPFFPFTLLSFALPGEPGAATFDQDPSAIEPKLLRQAVRRLVAGAHRRFPFPPVAPAGE